LPKNRFSLEIVNVVATASLDRPVDLAILRKQFPRDVEYDPDVYFAAYFKAKRMRGKISIFPSGKLISVGTKSEKEAQRDFFLMARSLEYAGIARMKGQPQIQNLVAIIDVRTQFNLENMIDNIEGTKILSEPEMFPGAIVYLKLTKNVKATFLVFRSGKIVSLGLKNREQLSSAVRSLLSKLKKANVYA